MLDQQEKLNTTVRVLAVLFVMWNSLAFGYSTVTTQLVNGDKIPDRMERVSTAQLGSEVGIVNGRIPLVMELPATSEAVVASIAGSYKNPVNMAMLRVDIVSDGRPVKRVEIPYEKIDWATGTAASMQLTYKSESVRVLSAGQTSDYWRFLTFRGPERYLYAGNPVFADHGNYAGPADVVANYAERVKITIPDTAFWHPIRTFGG